ncbi:hypothetical protein GPJ56_007100 [Histomonas meleagridis]|uniref:uncharacterized protein n=1 Tax=Histomonas meleagridis TaxID=135588 RepID=UPI00355A3E0B|nr:hypothetical protein GPJ56_007100 [Histomonas meleagridis]KAH0796105.1 hypothetical protein GO595_011072 [Histomonas meleagridis]
MTFAPIAKIPSSTKFSALITNDELLQINSDTVSIISARSGFCKYFYFLPKTPRLFEINLKSPERFALVYPSVNGLPESIVILETYTGKVLKQFNLKSSTQKFVHVSIGTHLFFVVDSNPSIVYYVQPTGTQIQQYECPGPITFLRANTSNPEFALISGKELQIIETQTPAKTHTIPFQEFTFLSFDDTRITYGTTGQVNILNLENSQVKTISTPHGSPPLNCTELYGVTKDGMIFSADTGSAISCVSSPYTIQSNMSTVAVFCNGTICIYESARIPVSTVSQLQPPEPFTGSTFSVESSLYFAAASAIYSFNISLNEISKFSPNNERIKKIVTTTSCLSAVYTSLEGDKIMTYVTGTKKRDEIGIDVACDQKGFTWILQKDAIISFHKKLLSIEEKSRIPLPEDHQYDNIFRLGDTMAIYSTQLGKISYLTPSNELLSFEAPKNVTIIQWPALCTKDRIYILKTDFSNNYSDIKLTDFVCIKESITSCCWLAKTLFAVEGRKVLAFNQKGQKRLIDILPNAMCTISAALPSQLLFVTTLPDLRVITLKRPFLFVALLDISSDDSQCLKYLLSYLPALSVEPRAITGLQPLIAMSVFNKAPPKYVNKGVVKTYSRFARFHELLGFIRKSGNDKAILHETAEAARKLGQFGIAQQIYEEIGDDESLFELFMIARSTKNLEVLASRSVLAPSIEYFGISPKDGEYEMLPNLPLPKIRQPYVGEEFTLYAGDPNESTPLYPPSFDELNDFGIREYPLTGEEKMAEQQAAEAYDTENQQNDDEEVEYKERPTDDVLEKEDDDLELNKLFEDDEDEEPVKKLDFSIKIKTNAEGGRRRLPPRGLNKFKLTEEGGEAGAIPPRQPVRNRKKFNINGLPTTEETIAAQPPQPPVENPEHQFMSEGLNAIDAMDDGDQQNPADMYVSTLFTDI